MKRIALIGTLSQLLTVCLLTCGGLNAHADPYHWYINAYVVDMADSTVTITPTGANLGPGGGCYYSGGGTGTQLAYSLTNASGVTADAKLIVNREADLMGSSGTVPPLFITLNASGQGTWESGANTNSTFFAAAAANCGAFSVTSTVHATYPATASDPKSPVGGTLNPGGGTGPYIAGIGCEAKSSDKGAYSYATASAAFGQPGYLFR